MAFYEFDIFISHAERPDAPKALAIKEELMRLRPGARIFIAPNSIPFNLKWRPFIQAAIKNSTCMLALWSKASVDPHRSGVLAEVHAMSKRGGNRLFSAIVDEDLEPDDLPYPFYEYNAALIGSWRPGDYHKEFFELLQQIMTRLDQEEMAGGTGGELIQVPEDVVPETDLLPYTVNRFRQDQQVISLLSDSRRKARGRQLAIFLRGSEYECHEMYVRKLGQIILPKALSHHDEFRQFEIRRMMWPLRQAPIAERLQDLLNYLYTDFNVSSSIDRCERPHVLVEKLSELRRSIIIYSILYVRDWQVGEIELIREWLRFWNDLPSLKGQHVVILSLSLVLHPEDRGPLLTPARWYSNNRAEQAFKSLNIDRDDGMVIAHIDPLSRIKQTEAEEWLDQETSRNRRLRDYMTLRQQLASIYRKYKRSPKQGLEMLFLAQEIGRMLGASR